MISVFTPSHDTRYLYEAYCSLAAQTYTAWEWVVLLNGGPHEPDEMALIEADRRVNVIRSDNISGAVGSYKREAVEACTGEYLVELDHDDLLTTTALWHINNAFDSGAQFVYSDCAEVTAEGLYSGEKWNAQHGWQYRDVTVKVGGPNGITTRKVSAGVYPEPLPSNMAYIWYEPNHVRAFSRQLYDHVGGYNETLEILDDQDIMLRMYVCSKFTHIPECLYLQRMHTGLNTQKDPRKNAAIQQGTLDNSDEWIERLMLAWCAEEDLLVTDLCAFDNPLIALECMEADSTGLLFARDVLQFTSLANRTPIFEEAYRVLAHGGLLMVTVPSTDGRLAFQNPDYVSQWNENSFWYYVNPAWMGTMRHPHKAKFQLTRSVSYYPTPWHQDNRLVWVRAELAAVKDGPRIFGADLWAAPDSTRRKVGPSGWIEVPLTCASEPLDNPVRLGA